MKPAERLFLYYSLHRRGHSLPSLCLLCFGLSLLLLLDLGPTLLLSLNDPSTSFLAHLAFGLFLLGGLVGLGWTTATAARLPDYGLWGVFAKHGSEFVERPPEKLDRS